MTIDAKVGLLLFGDILFYKDKMLGEFESQIPGSACDVHPLVVNQEHVSYSVKSPLEKDVELECSFCNNKLVMILLPSADLEKRFNSKMHFLSLMSRVGMEAGQYKWGTIALEKDIKTGEDLIVINYRA